MDFWAISGAYGPNFGAKKRVSPTFQSDHQVNPENRTCKDFKIAAVSEFATIRQSPPSSTGLYTKNQNLSLQETASCSFRL